MGKKRMKPKVMRICSESHSNCGRGRYKIQFLSVTLDITLPMRPSPILYHSAILCLIHYMQSNFCNKERQQSHMQQPSPRVRLFWHSLLVPEIYFSSGHFLKQRMKKRENDQGLPFRNGPSQVSIQDRSWESLNQMKSLYLQQSFEASI